MNCEGEDKQKRRETKSMGETVCSWIFTASHFSAKGNLASENVEIAPSYKVTLQKEKKQIEFSEGLKKFRIIFEVNQTCQCQDRQCSSGKHAYATFL